LSSARFAVVEICWKVNDLGTGYAERTGRTARVMELDPLYVDLIVRRWQSFTGNPASS
jgi:hypothetical protein